MKKHLFFIVFFLGALNCFSQNQLRIRGGILSTHTSVSEYSRGLNYFYFDSVLLDANTYSPQFSVDIDLDLGKRFFLTTGLGYSKKGLPSIHYINGDYWYDASQQYLGMNFQIKYHHKFADKRFGIFGAVGFKVDFAVGGPNNAEITNEDGAAYFHAFGTFNQVDLSLPSQVGLSYKLGPGDIVLDINFQNGLSDVFSDRFVAGRTFSVGACLGYSFYL